MDRGIDAVLVRLHLGKSPCVAGRRMGAKSGHQPTKEFHHGTQASNHR